MRKLFYVFLLACAMLLMSVGVLYAQTQVVAPSISGPAVMQALQNYMITGTGFAANEQVVVTFNGARLALVSADGGGSISATVKAPGMLPFGDYEVKGVGVSSKAEDTYTASLVPTLIAPKSTSPGAKLEVVGKAWAAGEVVTVTFQDINTCDGSGGTNIVLDTPTTTRIGSLYVVTSTPSVPPGTYYVCGVGATSTYTTTY